MSVRTNIKYVPVQMGEYVLQVEPQTISHLIQERVVADRRINLDVGISDYGQDILTVEFIGSFTLDMSKTDITNAIAALRNQGVFLLREPVLGDSYAKIQLYAPRFNVGLYDYFFRLLVVGEATRFSRSSSVETIDLADDFGITSKTIADIPIGATSISDATSFNRTAGVDGSIPCISDPAISTITYSVSEANLVKGNAKITNNDTANPRQYTLDNGLMRVKTRVDQASAKGDYDIQWWDGAAYQTIGTLLFGMKSLAGTTEYVSSLVPNPHVEIFDKQYVAMDFFYPLTPINFYSANLRLEMWRGKPFVKATLKNAGTTAWDQVEYKIAVTGNGFTQWTRNGVVRAAAGTGTITEVANTNTKDNAFLHTANPLAATTDMLGIIRMRKSSEDHVVTDNATPSRYNDYLIRFKSANVTGSKDAPVVWFFAQRFGQQGSQNGDNLGAEVLSEVGIKQTLKRVYS